MNRAAVEVLLTRHEKRCNKPYRDTKGNITIGVGRNLDAVGLFPDEVDLLLDNDINRMHKGLTVLFPWYDHLDDVRQEALLDLAFNVGVHGVLHFSKMIESFVAKNYDKAADEVLDSKLSPTRAADLAHMIRTGERLP